MSARTVVPPAIAAVAAVLVAASMAPVAAAPAALGAALPDCVAEAGLDLVVGLPSYDVGGRVDAGAVVVLRDVGGQSTVRQPSARQVLNASSFGQSVQAGARLGAAVVTTDLDGDGCLEIVAGAPGASAGRGAVLTSWGERLTAADLGQSRQVGAHFGAALRGLEPMWGGLELLVGEPGATVDGAVGAGRAYGVSNLLDPALRSAQVFEQGHGVVTGTSEPGDHFGAVLTGGYSDAYAQVDTAYLLVGVPDEDIGRHVDAGRVVLIGESAGSALHQDSPGVPGAAETGDRFGASVALDGYEGVLWFGAPGEDVSGFKDAGHDPRGRRGCGWADAAEQHRAHPGHARYPWLGRARRPVRGVAVVAHGGCSRRERRAADEAGAVLAFVGGGDRFAQGNGAPGLAEPFDHFGAKLSGFAFYDNGAGTAGVAMVVTVPGEDLGSVRNAGTLALQGWLSDSSGP